MIFNDNDIYLNIKFDNQRSYDTNFIGILLNQYFLIIHVSLQVDIIFSVLQHYYRP